MSCYAPTEDSLHLPVQEKLLKLETAEHRECKEKEPEGGEWVLAEEVQPVKTEHLSSRCILFTYFRGDVGDAVDDHFRRSLGQHSVFTGDTINTKTSSGCLWNAGGVPSGGQCGGYPSSQWSSSYSAHSSPCPSSFHMDFSPRAAVHSAEQGTRAAPPAWPAPSPHSFQLLPRHSNLHPLHNYDAVHQTHSPTQDSHYSPLLVASVPPPCRNQELVQQQRPKLALPLHAASWLHSVFDSNQ